MQIIQNLWDLLRDLFMPSCSPYMGGTEEENQSETEKETRNLELAFNPSKLTLGVEPHSKMSGLSPIISLCENVGVPACPPVKICAVYMFVGVCVRVGLSVLCIFYFFFWLGVSLMYELASWVSCLEDLSQLYLCVRLAAADRADVDNYKVFSQRANLGDACLRLPPCYVLIVLFFLSLLLLPLSCFSRNHSTTNPKCNL